MKLRAIVDTLDGIEEALHPAYTEFDDDGTTRYRLNIEGVQEHPETKALKNALDRQKQANREKQARLDAAEAKLADLPDDFDPDEYERLKAAGETNGKVPNEDEIRREASEAATKRAEAKAQKKLDEVTGERDHYKTNLESKIKREAIDEHLEKNGVTNPAYKKAARALLAGSIKVIEEDGEFIALAKDAELGEIPVAEHVKAWAGTEEGKAFVGARESAGGGATGGGSGNLPSSSEKNPFKAGEHFNVTEQSRLRKEDPKQAEKLMREAGLQV